MENNNAKLIEAVNIKMMSIHCCMGESSAAEVLLMEKPPVETVVKAYVNAAKTSMPVNNRDKKQKTESRA